tara:strand:- start:910 stop:1383 length:474 start_codon:yes stop_codon:yes gene_type:complete
MNLLGININQAPLDPINTTDIFKDKRVVIFGLPGAFTPTCSTKQVPGYEEMFSQFQEKGIGEIWCISVNDQFVMQSWRTNLQASKVNFLADGNGDLTRRMGMLVKKENLGFGMRSWRYAAVVNNGEVEQFFPEDGIEDNHGEDPYENSTPENVLKHL